jgi:hypothetical protein
LTVVQVLRRQNQPALEFLYEASLAHRKAEKPPPLVSAA